jgi:hypothetical protein
VERFYELGIEPSGSIKAGKLSGVQTIGDLSSRAQLHGGGGYLRFESYIREQE